MAKHLAMAGASVCVGTWPPTYTIFKKLLQLGKMKESLQFPGGGELTFERIYAFDGDFDTLADAPADILENKRYKDHDDFSIQGVADKFNADFGDRPLDIVVHSIANGPEVKKPLVQTSRKGYLAAMGASAYSFVSMVQRFGPLLRPHGAFLNMTFLASERVVPGYGGGMSSAKAALESDTRTLAYEAGRLYGARVNSISAGGLGVARGQRDRLHRTDDRLRAAQLALARSRSPPTRSAPTAAFLCSPLASGITGTCAARRQGLPRDGGRGRRSAGQPQHEIGSPRYDSQHAA